MAGPVPELDWTAAVVGAVQVDARLERLFSALETKYDKLVLSFAFIFNLRPCGVASSAALVASLADLQEPLILRGAAKGWPAMAPRQRFEWSLSRLLNVHGEFEVGHGSK